MDEGRQDISLGAMDMIMLGESHLVDIYHISKVNMLDTEGGAEAVPNRYRLAEKRVCFLLFQRQTERKEMRCNPKAANRKGKRKTSEPERSRMQHQTA